MLNKCSKYLKRFLIYMIIVICGLPVSLAMSGKASAAEKLLPPDTKQIVLRQNPIGQSDYVFGLSGAVKPQSVVEVSKSKNFDAILGQTKASEDGSFSALDLGDNTANLFFLRYLSGKNTSPAVALANDILPPAIKGLDNLKEKIYWQGEVITVSLSAEANAKVWAEIGNLDTSFPQTINFVRTDNGLIAKTPALTENLNAGQVVINVFAKDLSGNIIKKEISVFLKKLPTPKIISVKSSSETSLAVAWQLTKSAQKYQIEWHSLDGSEGGTKWVNAGYSSAMINNLESGTIYEITVRELRIDGSLGAKEHARSTTLGTKKIVATVLGEKNETPTSAVKTLKPAIGGGASIAALPKSAPAADQSSAKQEETATQSGWSKLLIALSILIIAAGVAIGGYYGYEWIVAKNSEDEETPKSNSRW